MVDSRKLDDVPEHFPMGRHAGMDTSSKLLNRRPVPEEKQVRPATAIRRAETRQWNRCVFDPGDKVGPFMLPQRWVVGQPDLVENSCCSKIVDVPVETDNGAVVMGKPGGQSAGSESAADVDEISGLQVNRAEFSNWKTLFREAGQDQRIGAGSGSKGLSRLALPPRSDTRCG